MDIEDVIQKLSKRMDQERAASEEAGNNVAESNYRQGMFEAFEESIRLLSDL